jgi:hypothetical protein
MQFAICRRITAADLLERAKERFSNTNPPPPGRVELLRQRFESGCDLFDGQPLDGRDLAHWLRLQQEREERVRSRLHEAMVLETA